MNLDRYPVVWVIPNRHYEFFSVGPKGDIRKVVKFQEIDFGGLYNVSFGDWDEEIQDTDTAVRSMNNDRDKILATIAWIVRTFMKNNPNATIYAEGQIPAKTRLYQMAVSKHLREITEKYIVEGYYDEKWEIFKRGKNYEALKIKQNQFYNF